MRVDHPGTVLFLTALSVVLSCNPHNDIRARYEVEKKLWLARSIEKKIRRDYTQEPQGTIESCIRAYGSIVEGNPLKTNRTLNWDPSVVSEIKRAIIVSKIAIADLYYLMDRNYLSGVYCRDYLENPYPPTSDRFVVRLNRALTLYPMVGGDSLKMQCEEIFKEIVASEDFWENSFGTENQILNIPLILTRTYRDRGDPQKYAEYNRMAEEFYGRIIQTWPDSLIAEKSMLLMIDLHLLNREWRRALTSIDELSEASYGERIAPRLLLLKGEILLYGLGKTEEAARLFKRLSTTAPSSHAAFTAKLDEAIIHFQKDQVKMGISLLKEIERHRAAPSDVRARAMLLRTIFLEEQGKWTESLLILRGIGYLYPQTPAAIQAPLLITRHYAATGERSKAEKYLRKAKKFYTSLIRRKSVPTQKKLIVEDFLIENYLLLGKAREVALMLEEESANWGRAGCAGALIKSAMIYGSILGDAEGASGSLKKCMESFPKTMYSSIAKLSLGSFSKNRKAGKP